MSKVWVVMDEYSGEVESVCRTRDGALKRALVLVARFYSGYVDSKRKPLVLEAQNKLRSYGYAPNLASIREMEILD